MNNQYDNLLEALTALYKQGYDQNFSLSPKGLYCPLTKNFLSPEQVKLVEFHRFEGDSDMSDMAILYVIETTGECRGVLIDAFGTYADNELGEFLKKISQ